jgi:NAD(P)H-dependent flavin oxidoreductase YrpB (nitropropane dioxygenase family)
MFQASVCSLLGISYPIVQAGMARGYTSAALVGAVSAAGGLGVLGCLDRSAGETISEIERIRELTDRPFALNFVLHRLDEEAFAAALVQRVPVIMSFRGDPGRVVERIHAAGALSMHQVTTVAEAREALAAGVDVLVAQGVEAGGHMGPNSLWSLLPAIVDAAGPIPVLAAGGIVDGRGLAAALCLGAQGVVIGTRFLATPESPARPTHKEAILRASWGDTTASEMFDILWGSDWPGVQARAIRNRLTERWVGREDALRTARDEALATLHQAETENDPEEMVLLAGVGAARINKIVPAGDLVRAIAAEASAVLGDLAGERS